MVRNEMPEPAGDGQSLGDLVALAAKDVSQLIRYEIDLAKTELMADVERIGLAGALGVVAAFVACLVLVLLSIALAFGLVALGIWDWAAFLIVAGAYVLFAVLLLGIAYLEAAAAVRAEKDASDRDRRAGDAAPRQPAPRRPAARDHQVR